ncbi:bifunctional 4-hydroxy-2-oxoglutarate aldolase/2-dehydro-3-deoxy-phosphogluconate aldolase [Komagataeibacter medellinensis]|uniref:2-dehydro-3-deoxy-phosphogluconate aldolase n=2 Tax=Komagataeibacter medellinensis TaxID=1177712 RepID=G2I1R6_KOMMN|nr:bifunctional 4-hydroxy-2-oxoglutarate aldolase/2-dehydro-3-deoxy-phosphogluconate aldolase [Komagataeibacter medellinensis]KAB8123548.1 bifunctional 4-hydroxy-2-oxoglutarate aldolase/2-dehydro-3-deoxy-phosphogluconate aldolase [Komagataeibacter medellinensis]BAK84852.1 2-dehydro-3-deoxyphosphogluconate aldolase/4-hydroxy-2-oxoglutarate aldolase [Komagataeibacter medellinensis NBRC 3288]
MAQIEDIMTIAPVIPVLIINDPAHARPVAEALVAGGLRALEVTLRTPCALEVIAEMAKVDGAVVGAGTVLNGDDLKRSVDAGARFIVSPGLTANVANAARAASVPLLPGTANASDIMRGLDLGLTHFKFFPATAAGGIPALKALSAPFGQARFCPTGGIKAETAAEWLALPSVLCVGGSWLVPAGTPDVTAITARARQATTLAA